MVSVSVICPTYQRNHELRAMVGYYCAQKFSGSLELLILDDSPEPAEFLANGQYRKFDVHYIHQPKHKMSIGAKLNFLVERARGDVVMRFDDDDYYAPHYVERMLELLGDGDILTLNRWFAYSPKHEKFCYWETDVRLPEHFVVSRQGPVHTASTEGWDPDWTLTKNFGCYGFAMVLRRQVASQVQFSDKNHREEAELFERAMDAGFRSTCAADTEGLVLHIVHERSTSAHIYPQYVLPSFMLRRYFPDYANIGLE
ncbi:glycosyltransferase family 2 protein [Nocardia sp. NPDC049220]|uniref:glycosyltransferase n=1 Tax=Nocardia sp. NPDC049220 TaxID=3155273 RepID=UPI00340A8641